MTIDRAELRTFLDERKRLFLLLPHAGFAGVFSLCAGLLAGALIPALNALATGWFVHRVSGAIANSDTLSAVALPIIFLFLLVVAAQVCQSGQFIAGLGTARLIDGWVRRYVREIALAPSGISHLEQSSFQDDIARASDLSGGWARRRSPGTAVVGQVVLVFRVFSAVLSAIIFARFSVWLAIVLLAASLLNRSILRRQWMYLAKIMDANAASKRRADYWSDLAISANAASELRLFGFGGWVMAKRHEAAMIWLAPHWRERRKVLRNQGPIIVLTLGSALAALLFPGIAAAEGRIEPGSLVTYLVAAWGIFSISAMGYEAYDIEYGKGSIQALDRLIAGSTAMPTPPSSSPTAASEAPAVLLEKVSFTYPGAESPTLHNFDLDIKAREVLAVVGHNGAGKTTLVKLISGLYRPESGRVLVDGKDLVDLDIDEWRARISAVFQDFVHYPATAQDNITLSAPESLEDVAGLRDAIRRAGAVEMVERLPAGLETPMWRGSTGGVDVSGGQWQKLALARVLFAEAHGRRLLILDEPTAHLDVRAEAEFFERVIGAVAGSTVVLISHRLSMVRQADRIALIDGGQVAELGTHDELMKLDREYARLFRLQASRFTEAAATP